MSHIIRMRLHGMLVAHQFDKLEVHLFPGQNDHATGPTTLLRRATTAINSMSVEHSAFRSLMGVAFFISRAGEIIRVPDNHIGAAIRDPEHFGLTLGEIEAAYMKCGERMGIEGTARREILLKVIRKGWIRVRRYRNYWSITADALTDDAQELLQDWAKNMLRGRHGFRETDMYMPVKISTSGGDFIFAIRDVAEGKNEASLVCCITY